MNISPTLPHSSQGASLRPPLALAFVAILAFANPGTATAQRPDPDSVRAIPCGAQVATVGARTPTVDDVWNAFRCRGDRAAVAVALWRRPLVDLLLLDVFRASVPSSAQVVELMFDAAWSDPMLERRFTALGVLARFAAPDFVVSPDDARRVSPDGHGALTYMPRLVDHPTSVDPHWGPVARQRIDSLAAHAPDDRIRAASQGVQRLMDIRQQLRRP